MTENKKIADRPLAASRDAPTRIANESHNAPSTSTPSKGKTVSSKITANDD